MGRPRNHRQPKRLHDGRLSRRESSALGFGLQGCEYRGSLRCLSCPWAAHIAKLCDYNCSRCSDQATCPCGQRGMWKKREFYFFPLGVFINSEQRETNEEDIYV
jgi:hypothetical protein